MSMNETSEVYEFVVQWNLDNPTLFGETSQIMKVFMVQSVMMVVSQNVVRLLNFEYRGLDYRDVGLQRMLDYRGVGL